ncbi:LAMI_0F15918g1_1 [Lachancea mirantina]|uniref:LAMI_0F15918g1_1 n=1 Tax=Lachancea mirantina TaxID=1230905 RepID=A0A1G4K4L4_9SACH|nr:LAMI_0F15918g1_1 [Lachancea mirantina]
MTFDTAEKLNTALDSDPFSRRNSVKDLASSLETVKEDTSFRSGVARLSICEDDEARQKIMQKLSRSGSEEALEDSNVSRPDMRSKRRRRRSSALSTLSAGGAKKIQRELSSQSLTAVPKRKKKKASVNASLSFPSETLKEKISMKDVREFVTFIFDHRSTSPTWLQINHAKNISKAVVLFVPGLQPSDFCEVNGDEADANAETHLKSTYLKTLESNELKHAFYRLMLSAPGSKNTIYSPYNSFVNVSLTKKEREQKREELASRKITLYDLLMSPDQLIENEYPIHPLTPGVSPDMRDVLQKQALGDEGEWVETKSLQHDDPHTFAVDCEMCKAKEGLVLTRVSVVDFDCNLIYDSLVKPSVPIIDYLTKYSGITEEKLRNVTTTLKDVQNKLLELVSADDVLIGHSLQSDLNALKLKHPRIIDTATIYEHKAGPPFKPALRYLASEYLHIDIQNNDLIGHDSFDDAKACMELTKLKLVNGLGFGVGTNSENLFQRLARQDIRSLCLNDYAPKQCQLATDKKNLEMKINCQTDEDITDNIISNMESRDLFVGRLRELEFSRGYATPSPDVSVVSEDIALRSLGERIERIYKSCPPSAAMIVCSGTGDTRDWLRIMGEINKLDREERANERKKLEIEIKAAVTKARNGIALVAIKDEDIPIVQ